MAAEKTPDLQRSLKGALILPGPGVVSAEDLVAMPEQIWRALRQKITDGFKGGQHGFSATCMFPGCGGNVFISEKAKGERRYPYFAHREGEGLGCPWHTHAQMSLADARAAQYQGNQVSPAHEFLCKELARLVRLDKRFLSVEIDKTYVEGDGATHGRFPDVRFKWDGLPECVLEVQLSRTFQPEISERGLFYQSKGMPLLWVLHGVEPKMENLPTAFRDVIHRHKLNAFMLDQEAIDASERQQTLVLRCLILDADWKLSETLLVRFDQLTFPDLGLPYYRNMLLPNLSEIRQRRAPWATALRALMKMDIRWRENNLDIPEVTAAFEALPVPFPVLGERYVFARLMAVSLTILSEATRIVGAREGYENFMYHRMPNLTASLNHFLQVRDAQQSFARVIEILTSRTAVHGHLNSSVEVHIMRAARAWPDQISHSHPMFLMLKWLIPEVFDDVVREELRLAGKLPGWATGQDTE